jgi:hypothetical protein
MRPGPLPPPRELSSDLLLERVRRNARATELILHVPHTHLEMSTVQTVAPHRAVLARRSGRAGPAGARAAADAGRDGAAGVGKQRGVESRALRVRLGLLRSDRDHPRPVPPRPLALPQRVRRLIAAHPAQISLCLHQGARERLPHRGAPGQHIGGRRRGGRAPLAHAFSHVAFHKRLACARGRLPATPRLPLPLLPPRAADRPLERGPRPAAARGPAPLRRLTRRARGAAAGYARRGHVTFLAWRRAPRDRDRRHTRGAARRRPARRAVARVQCGGVVGRCSGVHCDRQDRADERGAAGAAGRD